MGKLARLAALLLTAACFGRLRAIECPGVSSPCSCTEEKYGTALVCAGITSEIELENAVRENTRLFSPDEFVLDDSELRFIGHDAFASQKFQRITVRNTTLLALTDTRRAFRGLEDTLKEIVAERCSFVSHWDWRYVRHLRNLKRLDVVLSDLVFVSDMEDLPAEVRTLNLEGNEIVGLVPGAFSTLRNLQVVRLGSNQIATLERSMFPEEANNLELLDFSHNFLFWLPENMFSDMPSLKHVELSGNYLRTLNERVFGRIWSQLDELVMKDTNIICDCRLRWILERQKSPEKLSITCGGPGFLKGLPLTALKKTHLICAR